MGESVLHLHLSYVSCQPPLNGTRPGRGMRTGIVLSTGED